MISVVVSARVPTEVRDQLDALTTKDKNRNSVMAELLLGALRNRHVYAPVGSYCGECLMPPAAATHLTPPEVELYRKAGIDLGISDAPAR